MDEVQSYLKFFGLSEQPFAPTADPMYFYATRAHKECLFRLWNSIDERHGIAVVLGNYGTGKTTLLRKLLTGMTADQERYNTAVIASPIPSWTSFALMESIVTQFGLDVPKNSFSACVESLNRYLLSSRDRISTLIIDDAQNLNKRGQLELLRIVQNLETPQHKLLNLVFFAQLEWIDVLHAAPNFEQRINLTHTLRPIQLEETRQFIEFRLRQAGTSGERAPLFDDGAIRVIHAYADGSPRIIVTLCRNALLLAAQIKSRIITPEITMHTIEKTTVPDLEKRGRAAAVATSLLPGISTARPAMVADAPPTPRPQEARHGEVVRNDARDQRATELLLRAKGVARPHPREEHEILE